MRRADIFLVSKKVGILCEYSFSHYDFTYDQSYIGQPISMTMPLRSDSYEFDSFPPFFEGLLPEGVRLESFLRQTKIDRNDLFSQLISVGEDLVGAVTVKAEEHA